MRSIRFPKMFNTNNTNVWKSNEYKEATAQNILLLLGSERGELFGDPYYGLLLKHLLYEQNNYVLRDQLIDMIYTQIAIFIPQIVINRKDIEIIQDKQKGKVYCTFKAINQIDYTTNTYNLVLLNEEETGK